MKGEIKELILRAEKLIKRYRNGERSREQRIEQGIIIPQLDHFSIVYKEKEDYKVSKELSMLLLKLSKEIQDKEYESKALLNLGTISYYEKKIKEAIDYLEEALVIIKDRKNKMGEATALNNLGNCFESQYMYNKALDYFKKAIVVCDEFNFPKMKAISMNSAGVMFLLKDDLNNALKYFEDAKFINESIGDYENLRKNLRNIAILYSKKGLNEKAISINQEIIEMLKNTKNKQEECDIYLNIGKIYFNQQKIDLALKLIKEAEIIAKQINSVKILIRINIEYGKIFAFMGDFDKSLDYYKIALDIAKSNSLRIDIIKILENISELYRNQGELDNALRYLKTALKFCEQIKSIVIKGTIICNIGTIYYNFGKYQLALDYYEKSLKIMKEIKNTKEIHNIYSKMVSIYLNWGRIEKAEEYLESTLKICKELNDNELLANVYSKIASTYGLKKEYQKAIEFYKKSLNICEKNNYKTQQASNYNNIGAIFYMQNQYQKAINYYEKGLKISKEIGNIINESDALIKLGAAYRQLEHFEVAINYYKNALQIKKKIGDLSSVANIQNNLGIVYGYLKNYQEATYFLKSSVDIFEELIASVKSEESRRKYRERELTVYNSLVHAYILWFKNDTDLREDEFNASLLYEAVKFLEFGKAREIIDRLELEDKGIDYQDFCIENKDLLCKEEELTNKLSEFYQFNMSNIADGKSMLNFNEKILKIRKELKKLREEISEKCPKIGMAYKTSDYNILDTWQNIFKHNPNAVIWDFFYDEATTTDFFIVFVLTIGGIGYYQSKKFDVNLLFNSLKKINKMIKRNDNKSTKAMEDFSNLVSDILPPDLWKTIHKKEILYLIPHDMFHMIPWTIIKYPKLNDNTISYLGLEIPIVRNYNLSLINMTLKKERITGEKSLLISNPNFNLKDLNLLESEAEINNIIRIFKELDQSESIILLKKEHASKDAYLNKVKEKLRLVHFAGHGQFIEKDPWMSHLKFFSKNGFSSLTATEIMINKFSSSPLFVLNACDTAKEKLERGNEPFGLIRGLFLAGVNTIISTQWLIEDRFASEFIIDFYYNFLFEGISVAESLHISRVKQYNKGADLISWGAYTLYGNPNKLYN